MLGVDESFDENHGVKDGFMDRVFDGDEEGMKDGHLKTRIQRGENLVDSMVVKRL